MLRQADMAPLSVEVHGTLAEREAEGHDIGAEDRELMQRAIVENAVIVAQMLPFQDDDDDTGAGGDAPSGPH